MNEYSTWLEIDLDAVRNNVRQLLSITGRQVMAVIKANGYGHGIVEVGQAAASAGAGWLGVARFNEAVALRSAGVETPILVLGYCSPEWTGEAIAKKISLTIHHPSMIRPFGEQAQAAGGVLNAHAKFDSGMGRLGVFPEDGAVFVHQIREQVGLRLEGIFTHFASADEPQLATTDMQIDRFSRLVAELERSGMRPPLAHAANSAAALYYPRAHFDMVRAGIAIYGLHPSANAPLPGTFRAALAWKAWLISVKDMPPGHGIGYNHRYVTSGSESIGVIPVGYADGLRRRLGNFVLVGGRRVPLAGGVCMDQAMVRLGDVPQAKIGDEVVLIGRQGEARITAEDLGEAWGTVNYDVVCGLTARVPRIYLNQ